MITTFATQYYVGLNNGKTWKSLSFDDNLEDAVETLNAIYEDHCREYTEKGQWPCDLSEFRIKGLESEQKFTGE